MTFGRSDRIRAQRGFARRRHIEFYPHSGVSSTAGLGTSTGATRWGTVSGVGYGGSAELSAYVMSTHYQDGACRNCFEGRSCETPRRATMCIHPNNQSPFSAVRAISAVLRTRADLWGEFDSIRGRGNDNGAWSQWVALSVLDDWGPVVRRAITRGRQETRVHRFISHPPDRASRTLLVDNFSARQSLQGILTARCSGEPQGVATLMKGSPV